MTVVSAFLIVLLVAGGVLIWEARSGRLDPRARWSAAVRAGLFFAAAAVGGALVYRIAPSSLLLALALAPVTALSLVRLVMLVRQRRRSAAAPLILAALLFLGVSASLWLVPQPLDQRTFIEQIFHLDTGSSGRSIDPASRRSAWM